MVSFAGAESRCESQGMVRLGGDMGFWVVGVAAGAFRLVSFPAGDWEEEGGGKRCLCDKKGILAPMIKYKGME